MQVSLAGFHRLSAQSQAARFVDSAAMPSVRFRSQRHRRIRLIGRVGIVVCLAWLFVGIGWFVALEFAWSGLMANAKTSRANPDVIEYVQKGTTYFVDPERLRHYEWVKSATFAHGQALIALIVIFVFIAWLNQRFNKADLPPPPST